jgi:S-adenosylmethionine:tRNA ribosyltransferase-isomerase
MNVDDLDYQLPAELIAQLPAADRSASRLLHYRRQERSIEHRMFVDLPRLLRPTDLLVMNDARVTPARFMLMKPTGGRVEGLFVEQREHGRAFVMLRNLGPMHPDLRLTFEREPGVGVRVINKLDGGLFEIQIEGDESLISVLDRVGRMPLPPYIKRERGQDERDESDRTRYQTVYAHTPGSIAAPTAGLHFTPSVFEQLDRIGIERAFVTLHVGLGTFKPIETPTLEEHVMHIERYALPVTTCEAINRAKRDARRIVAVGTTSARVLESQPPGMIEPHEGQTQLLIKPPYEWKHVDALITNFHQPRSTLIALVAAFVGLDEQRGVYREAIERKYRFFSYGDAMLIE